MKSLFRKTKEDQITDSSVLDLGFYRNMYFDLSSMNDEQLRKHWRLHGQAEGRIPNPEILVEKLDVPLEALNDIDPFFYIDFYPDVARLCQGSILEAFKHYLDFGKEEGRLGSFEAFIEQNGLSGVLDVNIYSPNKISDVNNRKGVFLTLKNFIETLKMEKATKFSLSEDSSINSNFYRDLGKHYELNGAEDKARDSYLISTLEKEDAEVLELIGNYYMRMNDYDSAIEYYVAALKYEDRGRWIYENLAKCYFEIDKFKNCFDILLRGVKYFSEVLLFRELVDDYVSKFWVKKQSSQNALASMQRRDDLVSLVNADVSFIAGIYDEIYSLHGDCKGVQSSDSKRALIIGDFFLPQCVRYRIKQKQEQLAYAGYETSTIDWTKVKEDWSKIAFFDQVIFYRVPAVPEIVKAISYCKALGKTAIYEIDDMVFDVEYPMNIDSFGGYVDVNQYRDLTKGMALFNSAMKLCDFGIASTSPLVEKMTEVMAGKKCLLHRNALDSVILDQSCTERSNSCEIVNIFYGSGTKAHNSDFIEEALPSILAVLDKCNHARLVVAGFLSLPRDVLDKYGDRIKFLPYVSSVEAYMEYLKLADINLAVLKNDLINNCKSELKWFEAAWFSIPSVVSSTLNYQDVIDDGVTGYLCETAADWYEALHALVESGALRQEVGRAAKQKVEDVYSLPKMADSIESILVNCNKGVTQ